MQDLIKLLRQVGDNFNPPATNEAIEQLEQKLGMNLPDELKQLYFDHDGQIHTSPIGLRLNSLKEVWLDQSDHEHVPFVQSGEVCLFWTNDNSDGAGIYMQGPFKGMICLLEHESVYGYNSAPVYRNIQSFYAHQIASINQEYAGIEMVSRDYPVLTDRLPDHLAEADHALFHTALDRYKNSEGEEARQQAAYAAVNLVPYKSTQEIYPLLGDPDMYIQQAACELLGTRKWADARDLLEKVVLEGRGNGILEALRSLGKIPGGGENLLRLFRAIEQGKAPVSLNIMVINSLQDAAGHSGYSIVETEPGVFLLRSSVTGKVHTLKIDT